MIPLPPGLLPEEKNPEVIMMICTAGHVDHGKTLLVKMLTGCMTDRLKEEQERGMTIELGFAPCFLGGTLCVGIVDVPGHEKFVRTMVAGVSGIGLCILVIAADDGIMPQTIEHVQIMDLMGVRQGVVALTKTDLVASAQIGERQREIRAFLQNTFLADAPICPVSSKTFEGYGAFYDILVSHIRSQASQRQAGVFRMPIERIFALSGQGTIISGIPIDGLIQTGQMVEVTPGGFTGRVRGIQRFLRDAEQGGTGQCLALNIPDLNKYPLHRGQVLSWPGYLRPAKHLHAQLKTVASLSPPIKNAETIKLHTGTAEANGKIYLLENNELPAGQTGLATLVLDETVAVAALDRFILRRHSPPSTIAGGTILSLTYDEHRPRKQLILSRLRQQLELLGHADPRSPSGIDAQVEWQLLQLGPAGGSPHELSLATVLTPEVVLAGLNRLVSAGRVLRLAEDFHLHATTPAFCLREVENRLGQLTQAGATLSLSIAQLRQDFSWPAILWAHLERELEKRQQIRRQGDKVILTQAVHQLSDQDRRWIEAILAIYDKAGYQSPREEELPALTNAPAERVRRLVDFLCGEHRLIRLSPLVTLSYRHYKTAQDLVVTTIQTKGVVSSSDFKFQLNSSRKYALAILDFLDARRITVRQDNDRRLARDYEKHLL